MKIKTVDYWLVKMPFKEDVLWASGRRTGTTRLITRITTEEGRIGWGETICLIDTVWAVFEKVVAKLAIGYPISDVEKFTRNVLGAGYYHHKRAAVMAIAAIEMAMWDALGRATSQPLHALWGGKWRSNIEVAAYLLQSDEEACTAKAKWFRDQGYRTFKVKIGFDEASDVRLVKSLRRVLGDHVPLRADVNGAWYIGTAKRVLRKLAEFDLAYVEQPLPVEDLIGSAELRRGQPIPIAIDEGAYTLEEISNIVRMKAADVILLDPHESAGLWQTIKAGGITEAANLQVTLHSGAELGISQAAYLHLAASIPNMSLAIDTERAYLADDIVRNPPVLEGGVFKVPEGPGLGVEPDLEKIEKYSVNSISGAYLDPEKPHWYPVKPSY